MCTPPGDTYTVTYGVGVAVLGVFVLFFYSYIPTQQNVQLLWGPFARHKLKFKVASVVTATAFLTMYAYAIAEDAVTAAVLAWTAVFFTGACGWAVVASNDGPTIPVGRHRVFVAVTAVGSIGMAAAFIMAIDCVGAPHKGIATAAAVIVAAHHVLVDGLLWAPGLRPGPVTVVGL